MSKGHVIGGNGKTVWCGRCGQYAENKDSSVYKGPCAADLPKNQPHPSHAMKYSKNSNFPYSNDTRKCTKCGKISLQVNDFFSQPCEAR